MCDTPASVSNTRSILPDSTLTSSSAWFASDGDHDALASTQRTSCGARYSPRSMVLIVSPLGSAIRLSVFCCPTPGLL